jgi:hypothetical protein
MPEVPYLPGPPGVPCGTGAPTVPGVSGVPCVPEVPGVPKVAGAPMVPGIPDAPKVPGCPGVTIRPLLIQQPVSCLHTCSNKASNYTRKKVKTLHWNRVHCFQ